MITVFSKEWFKKYSKAITFVARLPFIGELIFNFKKFGHYVDRKKICEITPNSVIEYLGGFNYKQHFFVRNEYALRLQHVFYPIWITFHIWDIVTRPIPQLNLGFDTLTAYPVAGANSPCDGYCDKTGTTWANTRDASTSTSADVSNQNITNYVYGNGTNSWEVSRGGFNFTTSTLGSGATISASTFSITSSGTNYYGNVYSEIVSFSPSSTATMATGDYNKFGTTTFSSATTWQTTDNTYQDYSLNASGISNINKTGVSSFYWIHNKDYTNTEPSGLNGCECWSSDNVGGKGKPKLVVTYTTVVAPTVTTQNADQITTTSVRGNGNITATGGANATRRGFAYKVGTSGDPTVADSTAYDNGDFGTGAFTKAITSLTAGTGYRVRAYAINSAGTSYGSTVQVTTSSAGPANVKTYKGLASASVKTCKGLAIASVKTKKD